MIGRPHAQRLRQDMEAIRGELIQTVQELGADAFHTAPRPEMKTVQQQLQEIGAMEVLSRHLVTHGEVLDWEATWQSLDKDSVSATMIALTEIRAETLTYLDGCTEERIETPIPLPTAWQGYFDGATELEPEELLRWIVRHEYYHLGQLVVYGFLQTATA
jgi:uncharacterized damage-inducible protein DinB